MAQSERNYPNFIFVCLRYILGYTIISNCNQTLRNHAHAIYRFFCYDEKLFDIFFLIFAQNIDCGYKLEPPCLGGSNEYPHSMFWSGMPLHTLVLLSTDMLS